jgi:serine protease Do
MMKSKIQTLLLATVSVMGTAALLAAEDAKPRISSGEFDKKLARDGTEIKAATQPVVSYADVAERIMPSVVSISTFAKKQQRNNPFLGNNDDLDDIPPQFRQFFEDWMERHGGNINPKGNGGNGGNGERRRQRPQRPLTPQQTGLGSGIIITEDGYILTNNHVVDGADELKVSIPGHGKSYVAKVIGTDPSTDVALIKVEATGLPRATLGDSSKLRMGDVVLAAGSPMGLEQSITHGIVSALGRSDMGIIGNAKRPGFENFIQTDAAINPGNSGGPLADAQGRVIGMNSAIETQSGMFSGIGLAIPINMALSVVHDLLDTGKVERGFLGIKMDQVDPSMSESLGLKDDRGVTVSEIVENSPAAKAGFEPGDVILTADGQKIEDISKLRLLVSSHHPGTDVRFGIVRFNVESKKPERKELVARLAALPDSVETAFEKGGSGKTGPKSETTSFLQGVRVDNINDDLRQSYTIGPDVKGVVITNVDENSAAAKVGLQEGDVITRVNRKPVTSVTEARSNKGEDGGLVYLEILRNGQTKFVVVKN